MTPLASTANPPRPTRKTNLVAPWLEVAILAIAALVRLWRLDYHSIWFDEAVTLDWARAAPAYTWATTFELVQDKHPPLYYVALHFWRNLMGLFGLANSTSALRAFGALLGVITVWAILRLAAARSGRTTGLLTGLLVALSPILVWYSQELRMFQPATTLLVLAALSLSSAWDAPTFVRRIVWWIGFILAFAAALHTYLFSAFLLPAAGLTILFLVLRVRDARRFIEGAAALALVGLLFLPLAINAWGVNDAEGSPGTAFANFLPNLWNLLRVFTIWRVDWPEAWKLATLALAALLLIVGIALPRRRANSAHRDDRLWLLLWIGVPLLIANILLARSDSIFAEDRYLIFLVPFVLWAAARGTTVLATYQRPLAIALGPALCIALLLSLPRLWSPALARENWRAAAQYILNDRANSPGLAAAVVTHVDYTHNALEWYLRQETTFEQLPVFFPFGGTLTAEDIGPTVAPPLLGIVDYGAHTLWLTQSHLDGVDDARVVEQWLSQNFPLLTEQYPAGVKLSGYALRTEFDALPTLNPAAARPNVELAPGLLLRACEITTPQVEASDETMHPPSGWIHVRLWWEAAAPLSQDYMASVRMVGPEGVWGERLYREREPLRLYPSSRWTPGILIRDEVDVNLNPATPPGTYPIVVRAIDAQGNLGDVETECGRVAVR